MLGSRRVARRTGRRTAACLPPQVTAHSEWPPTGGDRFPTRPGALAGAGTCLPGKRTSAELNPCVTLAFPAGPRIGSALAAWAGRADGQKGRWAGWR